MPKVYNKHHGGIPENAVYIGRPSKWGNPYVVGRHGTREECVKRFADSLSIQDKAQIKRSLEGRDLVCWCAPKACHGDLLLEIANETFS